MSDIIYTPPASGGGGTTINPTNNFLPKRSNATTFVDSVFENGSDYLYSNYGGYTGLGLDFANFTSYLGDWNNLINGTTLVVNDQTNNIYTKWNGGVVGVNLDFSNNNYIFGSLPNGSTFSIDANNKYAQITLDSSQIMLLDYLNQVYTFGQTTNQLYINNSNSNVFLYANTIWRIYLDGINGLCNLGNWDSRASFTTDENGRVCTIGDYNGQGNRTQFLVDDNGTIISSYGSNDIGLRIRFTNNSYDFGDFGAIGNNTYIKVDDGSQIINFTTQALNFSGGSLQSNTSSGNSGEHLVITLNGTQYKIKLELP